MLCSDITRNNRNAIMGSLSTWEPVEGDIVCGYIFENDGRYHKYWLKYSPDNIARFICSDDKDKLICDGEDYALLNTIGRDIDLCINEKFLSQVVSLMNQYEHVPSEEIRFTEYQ